MSLTLIAKEKTSQNLIILKGGPGSGNWGHAGRPGKRGGSASGSGIGATMSIRSGRTAKSRRELVIARANAAEGVIVHGRDDEFLNDVAAGEHKIDYEPNYFGRHEDVAELENYDALEVSPYGGGYFIKEDGTLLDVTSEFSGGTNDHPGGQLSITNPDLFEVDRGRAKALVQESLKDEYDFEWQNRYGDVWQDLQQHTRVRYSTPHSSRPKTKADISGISFQPPTIDENFLGQMKSWQATGKIPQANQIAVDTPVWFEAWDGSNWAQTTWGDLNVATQHSDIDWAYKEVRPFSIIAAESFKEFRGLPNRKPTVLKFTRAEKSSSG